MVVIVIMGILAAVAVPKLFGMIAKSKASEVPTAAGTWINMQEAFIQEKNAVGDWVKIGYSAPGTKGSTNFEYASNVIAYSSEEDAATWIASPVTGVKLNDCDPGETWTLQAGLDAGGNLAIEAPTADNDADCTVLTASWDNLVHGTIVAASSAAATPDP